MSAHTTVRGTITVDVAACKGCELCLPACPPDVLAMSEAVNEAGFRYPLLLPGCTGCGRCVAVCPDFALESYVFDQPPPQGGAGAG